MGSLLLWGWSFLSTAASADPQTQPTTRALTKGVNEGEDPGPSVHAGLVVPRG